jgi:hypothetical protein
MTPYKLPPTTGPIPVAKVVGRMTEIEEIYELTLTMSVVISMIRRMGKTLLLQKFAHITVKQDRKNKAIWFDLMKVNDVTELTDSLIVELTKHQKNGWLKVQLNRCKELYNKFKPDDVKISTGDPNFPDISFKLPAFETEWKKALTACIEDLADRTAEKDEVLTLILDEFPYMLWQWILDGKVQDVIELLNLFRSLRMSLQEKGKIRFIICGSIGLDVVLSHLRKEYKYTAEPFNDTKSYVLEAMLDADAQFLCECLALSDFTFIEEKSICIKLICEQTENLPFYINKIFEILRSTSKSKISVENIRGAVDKLLTDVNDDDVFEQLDTRIASYYPEEEGNLMTSVLDSLSESKTPKDEASIIRELDFPPKETKATLRTLCKDQYLHRTVEGETKYYQFKYNLFRKWWKLNKA